MKNFILSILFLLPSFSFAQIFIEASVGNTYPLFNNEYTTLFEQSGLHIIEDGKDIKSELYCNKLNPSEGYYIKTNLGYKYKRINFGMEFSYLDNSIFKNSLSFNKSENQYIKTYTNLPIISTNNNSVSDLFFTKWINTMPFVSLNITFKKMTLIPKVGISIDYITLYRDHSEINFTRSNHYDYDTLNEFHANEISKKFKYQSEISISPFIGFMFQYKISNTISMFCEMSYMYKKVNIKKEMQYYSEDRNILNNTSYINTEEIEYASEFSLNMTNIRSSFGIRYSFSKKSE